MQILIIGAGGREHAIAWKIAQSPRVSHVYVAPGNAGTAHTPKVSNVDIDVLDLDALASFHQTHNIHLSIVGPEAPLVAGIVDHFEALGLRIFGPRRKAAQLEGSKVFSKDFLKRHHIPSASYQSFNNTDQACAHLAQCDFPVVIKADGLAAGKGVVIAQDITTANEAVHAMLQEQRFGSAGHDIVIESFLQGEEASFICVVDGLDVVPLASSQDHKARDDGDQGPNTGGMGAYSPAPVITQALHQRILDEVIHPTVRGLEAEDCRFRGFLYAGIMVSPQGDIHVLEFNVRLGDPETQPILARLESDLLDILDAAVEGQLPQIEPLWSTHSALGVVMAAGGYPEDYARGEAISGTEAASATGAIVFHAGTCEHDGKTVTNGGRVLCVVGKGERISDAQAAAYAGVEHIQWEGHFYRTDIGYRAVARENNP